MKKKKINVVRQEAKSYASMQVEAGSGSAIQSYNSATGETYPNRSLAPLVLTPVVGYSIPDEGVGVANAATELTDGRWYRLDGSNTSGLTTANEIRNKEGVYVIDTTLGSANYGRIKIYENIAAGKSVTYVFTATLSAGTPRKVMVPFRTECRPITVAPTLSFDNSARGLYNPWEDSATFTITPKIAPSGYKATFAWETLHGGVWGALGSTLLDWPLAVSSATGALTIRRDVMPDRLDLRCVATVTVEGVKTQVTGYVTHTRRLPWFEYDMTHVGNVNRGTTTLNPRILVRTSGGTVSTPGEELDIRWYGSGTSPVARGETPSIPLSSLGAASELGVEAVDRGGWCALTDGDGAILTDGDGVMLIGR